MRIRDGTIVGGKRKHVVFDFIYGYNSTAVLPDEWMMQNRFRTQTLPTTDHMNIYYWNYIREYALQWALATSI